MTSPLEIRTSSRFPLKFHVRPGTSDDKALREVIEKNAYQKAHPRKETTPPFTIEPGEEWVDLGGNIGAFAVLAAHLGAAHVHSYEADPDSFEILKKNIALNGFESRITAHHLAVVGDGQTKAWLSVSEKNKNYWRNSIVKQWQKSRMIQVPCVNFKKAILPGQCVKMDIEGSEMPILERLDFAPKKLVFEWSFDIDPDCQRFRDCMKKLAPLFASMDYRPISEEVRSWPPAWFPAAMTIFCLRERRGVLSEKS